MSHHLEPSNVLNILLDSICINILIRRLWGDRDLRVVIQRLRDSVGMALFDFQHHGSFLQKISAILTAKLHCILIPYIPSIFDHPDNAACAVPPAVSYVPTSNVFGRLTNNCSCNSHARLYSSSSSKLSTGEPSVIIKSLPRISLPSEKGEQCQ